MLTAFRQVAAGAGIIPWQLDLDRCSQSAQRSGARGVRGWRTRSSGRRQIDRRRGIGAAGSPGNRDRIRWRRRIGGHRLLSTVQPVEKGIRCFGNARRSRACHSVGPLPVRPRRSARRARMRRTASVPSRRCSMLPQRSILRNIGPKAVSDVASQSFCACAGQTSRFAARLTGADALPSGGRSPSPQRRR